jgi:NAD(P)-dependent dehydrogenase (short-subunit alcohol dehydrogenase family)
MDKSKCEYNPFSLKNKTIMVTGASSGIGRSVAIEASRLGATLVITGRNQERLNETLHSLEGNEHIQIVADLTISEEIYKLEASSPQITGLVHCAGMVKTLPFPFVNRQDINSLMEINYTAPVLLTQLLLKQKKLKKESSIVFISSISGTKVSYPGNAIYSATKGAVSGMVKGMAIDLATKGIRVNSVAPGMIDTGLLVNGSISQDQIEDDIRRYPLKRYGKPEEVSWAVVYLLSDASKWVTGSNLLIDGGYTLL